MTGPGLPPLPRALALRRKAGLWLLNLGLFVLRDADRRYRAGVGGRQ